MLEVLAVITVFGYIYYLRNYADLRSKSEKELTAFSEGIDLYKNGRFDEAYQYFESKISGNPKSAIAYLYRGLSQKSRNNRADSARDIQTAVSIDDDVYQSHLELGKMFFEDREYQTALANLDKAILKALETSPESYYWRGQVYLNLNRNDEAKADFDREKILIEKAQSSGNLLPKIHEPFVDKRLVASMGMAVFTSVLLVSVIKNAESIHLPYLVAVIFAVAIGFVEPRKGWFIAVLQGVLVLSGYFLFTEQPETSGRRELENFSLYGAIILTFAASFLGGFIKRALNMK